MTYAERPTQAPRFGFTAYADDTPRFQTFDQAVIEEDRLYGDDIYDGEYAPPEPSDLPSAWPRVAAVLAAAVAIAVAAFVATTLVRPSRTPATRTTPSAAGASQPLPGALENLPPRPSAADAPVAALPTVAPQPVTASNPNAASGKGHWTARKSAYVSASTCARPASRAQRMVCHSASLRAADRRMMRAYAQAQSQGAPPRALRQDQMRWLAERDAAAHRSRRAVARLYRERTAELKSRPYGACAGYASGARTRWGLGSATHWLLSVPGKIASPRGGSDCGLSSAPRR